MDLRPDPERTWNSLRTQAASGHIGRTRRRNPGHFTISAGPLERFALHQGRQESGAVAKNGQRMTLTSLPRPVGRQKEVLYLPAQGHTVVLGTAGSGKTTLAILRSFYLADPSTAHGGRTLLATFNRCLVTYMEHLAGASERAVDVRNYHHFARGYLDSRNKLPRGSICSPDERLCFIQAAVQDARDAGLRSATLKQPPAFFNEEFQWIQRQGIGNKQDYVDVERTGRSTRVRKAERADVFDLYKRYLGRRGQAGKRYDWDDLASAVRRELGDDGRQRFYSHVVIDEGQDFSPEMLRSLAAAAAGLPDGVRQAGGRRWVTRLDRLHGRRRNRSIAPSAAAQLLGMASSCPRRT